MFFPYSAKELVYIKSASLSQNRLKVVKKIDLEEDTVPELEEHVGRPA